MSRPADIEGVAEKQATPLLGSLRVHEETSTHPDKTSGWGPTSATPGKGGLTEGSALLPLTSG